MNTKTKMFAIAIAVALAMVAAHAPPVMAGQPGYGQHDPAPSVSERLQVGAIETFDRTQTVMVEVGAGDTEAAFTLSLYGVACAYGVCLLDDVTRHGSFLLRPGDSIVATLDDVYPYRQIALVRGWIKSGAHSIPLIC